ncbi:hypothetical protein BJ912DRAFT_330450 [Pholiota molesta]|nr:hypothetical protein BJ912DRAFT_330450 [Pholiota molesta]
MQNAQYVHQSTTRRRRRWDTGCHPTHGVVWTTTARLARALGMRAPMRTSKRHSALNLPLQSGIQSPQRRPKRASKISGRQRRTSGKHPTSDRTDRGPWALQRVGTTQRPGMCISTHLLSAQHYAHSTKLGSTAAQQRHDCNRERQGRAAGSLGVTGKRRAIELRVSNAMIAYEKGVDNPPGAERRRGRRSAREGVIDVRHLCAPYKRMRGGPAKWASTHERRREQLGAISEQPPICSPYQRGRRQRAEGLVKKRGRRA